MRTERQRLPAEPSPRARPGPDVAPLPPVAPSANGHHANGHRANGHRANGDHAPGDPRRNGHHAHGNGANGSGRLADVVVLPDWDAFLPARASTSIWRRAQRAKRVFDFVAASVALALLVPLFVVVALLIRLTSRGPIFYVCEYVGHRGRRFPGYKFRTMVRDAEAKKAELVHLNHMKGPAFKIRDDPRITPIGKVLRKFSIDELPQLWNVIRGDMSLVGPRPPLPEEWIEYRDWHRGKLSIVPGITCYWQINGRSEIADFDDWARLDLQYIDDWSLWTDTRILLRTVPAVLKGRGAY